MPVFFNAKPIDSIYPEENKKGATYKIQEKAAGKLETKQVYLATSETESISKVKQFGCLLFAHILSLFDQEIGSAVYYTKAATGKQVVAITVDENVSSDTTVRKIKSYNKAIQGAQKYEKACNLKEINLAEKIKLLKEAADLGHPQATYDLAMILKKDGKSSDAAELLEQIAKEDTPLGIEASLQLGMIYSQGANPQDELAIKHLERFQLKADKQDANLKQAKERLGNCYEREGKKLLGEEDWFKAEELFKKGIALGNTRLLFSLGTCYLREGHQELAAEEAFASVVRNETLSDAHGAAAFEVGKLQIYDKDRIFWFRIAHRKGAGEQAKAALVDALVAEGHRLNRHKAGSYEESQARRQAEEYFKEAHALGNMEATFELGLIKFGSLDPEAVSYLEKAAKFPSSKQAEAALKLGRFHLYGLAELPIDVPKAVQYFEQAYNLGEKIPKNLSDDIVQYALTCENATPPDIDKAKLLLEKAVSFGNANAMSHMGRYFLKGLGVSKDPMNALSHFDRAHFYGAKIPTEDSDMLIQSAIDYANQQPPNFTNAQFCLEAAIKYGNAKAIYQKGVFHLLGRGYPKDAMTALTYFEQAQKLGESIKTAHKPMIKKAAIDFENETPPASDKAKLCLDKLILLGVTHAYKDFAASLYTAAYKLRYETPLDLTRARHLFERSALYGSTASAFELSMMCKRGIGGPVDLTKAAQFEKQYTDARFKELSERFTDIGTVLTIASNIPRSEESTTSGEYAPEVKAKREEYLDGLRKQGVLTPTETMPYYDSRGGVCAGMSTEFLIELTKNTDPAEEMSATFLKTAQARQSRPGVTATALHAIVEGIYQRPSTTPPVHHFKILPSDPADVATRIRDHAAHHHHLSKAYTLHSLNLSPVIELGMPGSRTDEECIEELMHPDHKDGMFKVVITTGHIDPRTGRNVTHAIVVCKDNGKLRVWDPSYVGIELGTSKAFAEYLKEAWPFPPSNNHQVSFFRVEKQTSTLTT